MIKKICAVSGKEFEITSDDLGFYRKMEIISVEDYEKLKSREITDCVGLPTLCPEERQRRRLAWRNERKLYSRKCDLCEKQIVSIYDKDAKFPVYCQDCWWSDKWDAKEFSRDFDFSRPFFEQFGELMRDVPQILLWNRNTENADYNNGCFDVKNCYLNFCSDKNQDCYYNYITDYGNDVVDCFGAIRCELCYELIDSENCFDSIFLQNCENCSNSLFLKNCKNCINCFGCINIKNKEFYFLNKKLSAKEWKNKISELNLNKYSKLNGMRDKFVKFCQQNPQRFAQIINSEKVSGDYIFHSKNITEGFDVYGTENGKYIWYAPRKNENVMDNYAFADHHWTYECISGQGLSNSKFIIWINNGPYNSEYSKTCVNNCHNLFGCIGLKHAQYCILNKQYSKEEYFKTREKIIAHMKKTGEWGEFFPIKLSPFSYNETVAQEYFPLKSNHLGTEKTENFHQSPNLKFKYKWKDKISRDFRPATIENIPDDIADVEDSICREILACENCGKNYQIQKPELRFYRKMNLPIPQKCPDCRHADRMKLRNPRTLFERNCDDCKCKIQTTFAPDRPEKVLCEKCYLKVVD